MPGAGSSTQTEASSMSHLLGQPPGYQRAAWAAAGLPEPPGATCSYPWAAAAALREARQQGHGEGFLAGAAAAAEEARSQNEERDAAIRWALSQAAEAQAIAHQALQAAQQQQGLVQHLQQELEKLKHKMVYHESAPMGAEGHRNEAPRPEMDFMDEITDNVRLFNVRRRTAEEEPLSKRLRALHEKNDKG